MADDRREGRELHAVGNGRVCAYLRGADIAQLFGPTYSAPTAFSVELEGGADCAMLRRRHTDIWDYTVRLHCGGTARVTDTAAEDDAVFMRSVESDAPVAVRIKCESVRELFRLPTAVAENTFLGYIPAGTPFYCTGSSDGRPEGFVSDRKLYAALCVDSRGGGTEAAGGGEIELRLARGRIIFAFSESYGGALELLRKYSAAGADETARERTIGWERRADAYIGRLGERQKKYADVCDDIFVLISTQQSASGGVLAGYNYHLAYIRDNYGVNRGLLAMKCFEQSRRLIEFYRDVFAKYGQLHNAQATDSYGFHIHENDCVEITGYMILMCADYYEQTGDAGLLREMRPVIEWCASRQSGQLRNGALPFNGDETYIAGGIVERSAINDASMEATALCCASFERAVKYSAEIGLPPDAASRMEEDARRIRRGFAENFFDGSGINCNRPGFYGGSPPELRYGVRVCGHGGMGICVRNANDDYVCPDCAGKTMPPIFKNYGKVYRIPSALMMPAFVGADVVPAEAVSNAAARMADEILSGRAGKSVGYDSGLLSYVLRDATPEKSDALLGHMLSLRDGAGAWVEYYVGGEPNGTMYRPWESGINICALLAR